MPNLMMPSTAVPPETEPRTRIGGKPLASAGTVWPACRSCKGALLFLGQVRLSEALGAGGRDGLLLLFQCQNKPGMCDEWDANGGGNHARVAPVSGLVVLAPPLKGKTSLAGSTGVEFKPFTGEYGAARKSAGGPVLGQSGGEPEWVQADETPSCACGKPMQCVVQLEEKQGLNFGGGGSAYAFVCAACPDEAKFLWQC